MNLRFDAGETVVLRAVYDASISRPNLEQAAPRIVIEQDDDGDVEAEVGAPDLDRQEAPFSLRASCRSSSRLLGGRVGGRSLADA